MLDYADIIILIVLFNLKIMNAKLKEREHMEENEYEEWFEKYLGNIESLDKDWQKSPLNNVPKPFNSKKWFWINCAALLFSLFLSLLFSFLFDNNCFWLFQWLANAFLNLSLGLLVGFFIFIFTNQRDSNIMFYTDVIPILKKRYGDMHSAYYQFIFKISRHRQQGNYEKCYEAWHILSNTSFVIIGFFEFLLAKLPFNPQCFNGLNQKHLEKAKDELLASNKQCQEEFFRNKKIEKTTLDRCEKSLDISNYLLSTLKTLIEECEDILFNIKYNSKTVKKNDGDKDKAKI